MRCTRASAILFAVALAGADARAQEPILDHLIPTWSEASLAASPLLPGPEFGAMAAVYCDVPLGTPWAVAIRKRDGDVAVLELRRARYVGETHIGGLEVTSSPVSMGLAIAVSEAVGRMVDEATKPERNPIRKRDGSSFYFMAYRDAGPRIAWKLSPAPTSRPGRLVELAGMLFTLSQFPDAERAQATTQLARDLLHGTQR